jgi:starch-binding outer membrane protein, SusD/RagB family
MPNSMTPMHSQGRRIVAAALLSLVAACSEQAVPNFNNPDDLGPLDPVQLPARAAGLLAGDRLSHEFQILIFETMGRDVYRIDSSDPRFITNPLGTVSSSGFIGSGIWNGMYNTIRGANDLIARTDAAEFLTAEQKHATKGFAHTIKALEYMRLIETRDTLGVPLILNPSHALAVIRCKPAVLDQIIAVLDSGRTELLAAGTGGFPFALPGGFRGFTTAPNFLRFNRGLAAKIQIYRGYRGYRATGAIDAAALNAALAAVDESFYALDAAQFRTGVFHVYSNGTGDQANGNFGPAVMRANPRVVNEADPGDRRVATKVVKDPSQLSSGSSVSSDYLLTFPGSSEEPVPLLLNLELILLRAQALWGLNRDAEALVLSNFVRQNDGGLTPVAGLTHAQLLREILKQKRYSLLYESPSRIIDYRMFNIVAELGEERARAIATTPTQLPFPQTEIDARAGNITCTP